MFDLSNRLDDRSHNITVDPTVEPTGWTVRLVQQLDRVNRALDNFHHEPICNYQPNIGKESEGRKERESQLLPS